MKNSRKPNWDKRAHNVTLKFTEDVQEFLYSGTLANCRWLMMQEIKKALIKAYNDGKRVNRDGE